MPFRNLREERMGRETRIDAERPASRNLEETFSR